MFRSADTTKPRNDLAQSVKKDDEKQNGAQNAELDANAPARSQQLIFG